MRHILIAVVATWCCFVLCAQAADEVVGQNQDTLRPESELGYNVNEYGQLEPQTRNKRTILLKKKLIGAGLIGFGLGAWKGYKLGRYAAPEVHHVYLPPPPPPVKYVEYFEKPVYDGPVFTKHEHYSSW